MEGREHSGRLPASLPSASQVGQVITASAALSSRYADREPSPGIRYEGKHFPHCVCLPRALWREPLIVGSLRKVCCVPLCTSPVASGSDGTANIDVFKLQCVKSGLICNF